MTLIKPTELGGIIGSLPLGGKYNINCPDPTNPLVIVTTGDIGWNWWGASVEHKLMQDIPFLSSKIYIKDLTV